MAYDEFLIIVLKIKNNQKQVFTSKERWKKYKIYDYQIIYREKTRKTLLLNYNKDKILIILIIIKVSISQYYEDW
jgi:hypothetical protein